MRTRLLKVSILGLALAGLMQLGFLARSAKEPTLNNAVSIHMTRRARNCTAPYLRQKSDRNRYDF